MYWQSHKFFHFSLVFLVVGRDFTVQKNCPVCTSCTGKNFAPDLWATANLTASLKVEDYLSTLANNVKTSVTLDCDQTRKCYKVLTLSLDEIMWATNSYIVLSNAQPCSIVVTICKNLTSTNVNLCGRGKRGKRREKHEGKIENLPPFFPSNACHIGSAMLTFSPN